MPRSAAEPGSRGLAAPFGIGWAAAIGGARETMVGRRGVIAGLGAGLALPAGAVTRRARGARRIGPYDFPLADPFAATGVGTPPQVEADRPELRLGLNAFRARTGIPSGRQIPDLFWYDRRELG